MQSSTRDAANIKTYHEKLFYKNINMTMVEIYSDNLSEIPLKKVSLIYLVIQISLGVLLAYKTNSTM